MLSSSFSSLFLYSSIETPTFLSPSSSDLSSLNTPAFCSFSSDNKPRFSVLLFSSADNLLIKASVFLMSSFFLISASIVDNSLTMSSFFANSILAFSNSALAASSTGFFFSYSLSVISSISFEFIAFSIIAMLELTRSSSPFTVLSLFSLSFAVVSSLLINETISSIISSVNISPVFAFSTSINSTSSSSTIMSLTYCSMLFLLSDTLSLISFLASDSLS